MAKLDYQRFVGRIDLTPRSSYRMHIDNLLDANQKLYDSATGYKVENKALRSKVEMMDRVNQKLLEEIRRLNEERPRRLANGRFAKNKQKTS